MLRMLIKGLNRPNVNREEVLMTGVSEILSKEIKRPTGIEKRW